MAVDYETGEIFMKNCNEAGFYVEPKFFSWLVEHGYFTAPASTKYHGNFDGGLFQHHLAVYHRLRDLTAMNNLKWERPESPFIIGMFHDLCKCDQYKKVFGTEVELQPGVKRVDSNVAHYEYNDQLLLKGHGSKSVILLSQFMTLTEEEILCIRYHMGAYEKDEWPELDLAIRKCPNVLFAHLADMLASKIDGI